MSQVAATQAVATEAVGDSSVINDTARPAATAPLHLTFALNFTAKSEAVTFVNSLTDPSSTNFHKWIKPAQFGAMFGASNTDVSAVVAYLSAHGFSNVTVSPDRLFVFAQASRSQVETTLDVNIHGYNRSAGDIANGLSATYFAPDQYPTLDTSIAGRLQGIYGLSNSVNARPAGEKAPLANKLINPIDGAMDPSDLAHVYDTSTLHNEGYEGQGETIAIWSPTLFVNSDVQTFLTYIGDPNTFNNINIINVNGGATDYGGQDEACLDIETCAGQDPNATIDVYEGPNDGSFDIFFKILADDPNIMSMSWGSYEDGLSDPYVQAEEVLMQEMSAEGISMFVSSADHGSYDSAYDLTVSADSPATSAYVTAVGGTELDYPFGPNESWNGEIAWTYNDGTAGSGWGSGGGISIFVPRPSWQKGPGVTNSVSDGFRQEPDISALGSYPYYDVFTEGSFGGYLGTSCSTPLWASSMALIEESAGGGSQGNIDPTLYRLASNNSIYRSVFHDITSGNNGAYTCTPNWDFVTGWGSVDFGLLSQQFQTLLTPAATPVISANPGFTEYNPPVATISDSTSGAFIYYNFTASDATNDGTWTAYTGPITIEESGTLTAKAGGNGFSTSPIASAVFTVTPLAPTPVITPVSGVYANTQNVNITDSDTAAIIYYTTDGNDPVVGNGDTFVYTGDIPVSTSEIITAQALDTITPFRPSAIASQQYSILQFTPAPVITPPGGPLSQPQTVTITDSLRTASIYYYITNSTGATTGYALYTKPLTVSGSETITAVAVAAGYLDGPSTSASFNFSNGAPVPTYSVSPAAILGNVYSAPISVTLLDSVSGATIFYTTDGTPPGPTSQVYTSPITVSSTETINAVAVANGYTESSPLSVTFTILQSAPAPVISPEGGIFPGPQIITISDTLGAAVQIYYTLDGSVPTDLSTQYTGPITVSSAETINAIAIGAGYDNSLVTTATFNITAIAPAPTITPTPGPYLTAQSVTLSDVLGAVASIYYTTDGSTPTVNSAQYTAPFEVTTTETINAIAVAPNFINSAPATGTFLIDQNAPAPTFNPPSGPYAAAQNVVIQDVLNAAASLYYTTDGSTPVVTNGVPAGTTALYAQPVAVSSSESIRAIAVSSGYLNSNPSSSTYLIGATVPSPNFTPPAGPYTSAQAVTLSDPFTQAVIYYTLDGDVPVVGNPDTTEYSLASTTLSSATAIGAATIPVASVSGFTVGEAVIIDGSNTNAESAVITAVTATPTPYLTIASATLFSHNSGAAVASAINVASSETINAIAVEAGYKNSLNTVGAYIIGQKAATPSISPNGGASTGPVTVTLADSTPGVTIYYTIDGTLPTAFSAQYQTPLALTVSTQVSAIAIETGYTPSTVATVAFTVGGSAPVPTISPAGGAFTTTQLVTLADTMPGAAIYYTTDGSQPTANSNLYTSPVTVSATGTLKAIAVNSGYFNSSSAAASFTIGATVPTPTITPNGGQFAVSQSVSITDSLAGTTIYYTTDGSTPSLSSTVYAAPFALTGSETVQAIAVASGYLTSSAASASFTIATATPTPTISPNGGSIANGNAVTLSDTLSGAVIYYTTDGSTPTTSSSVYSSPIVVTASETINAVAIGAGRSASAEASAAFTVTVPIVAAYSAGLQLISLPESYSGVSLDTIFGYSGVKLAVWLAASNYYPITPTPPANEIIAGQGYWVRFPINVAVTLQGTPTPTNTPFVIPLHAGWNMVGDPFPFTVPLSSLTFNKESKSFSSAISGSSPLIGSSVYSYNSSTNAYVTANTLSPSVGYWVFAYSATDLDVPAPFGS